MRDKLTTTEKDGILKNERTGMLIARHRWTDPATGLRRDTTRIVPRDEGMTWRQYLGRAEGVLVDLRRDIAATDRAASDPHQTFDSYARALIAQKRASGAIGESTFERYTWELDKVLKDRWGACYLDKILRKHVKDWMAELGSLVLAGEKTPETVNGPGRVFRMVMKEAAIDFTIANPCMGVPAISTTLHRTYTDEQPNSLEPGKELRAFFTAAKEVAPHFYAYLKLGTITGRRPCELRPLRATGDDADIDWDTGRLYIRRSQVRNLEPSNVTKTKKDVRAVLPQPMIDTLAWHRGSFCMHKRRQDLLFPPRFATQEYMHYNALDKALTLICKEAKIKKHLSQRFMRRTYQDIARGASLDTEVQKAISGHGTDEMMAHYSTVALKESKKAITQMLAFTGI